MLESPRPRPDCRDATPCLRVPPRRHIAWSIVVDPSSSPSPVDRLSDVTGRGKPSREFHRPRPSEPVGRATVATDLAPRIATAGRDRPCTPLACAVRRQPAAGAPAARVIRDRLTHSLRDALARRRAARTPGRCAPSTCPGTVTRATSPTSVALQLKGHDGAPPREIATRIRDELARGRRSPHVVEIDIAGPGLPELPPRPGVDPRRARARPSPRAIATATPTCWRVSASTSSSSRRTRPARCTRAAGAGSRSATRSPTCSRRRAPRCTASTTSTTREPARHVRRVAARARARRGAARRRLPWATTSSRWPSACAPSSATTSRSRPRASGATSEAVRELRDDLARIGVFFDTWFSERAAPRTRRRQRRVAHARRRRPHVRGTTARRGCARPSSVTRVTASSCAATARPPISRAISRTTATRCAAGSRTSSTSGAPITTVR